MKKLIIAVTAIALAAVSCQKQDDIVAPVVENEPATLTVALENVTPVKAGTGLAGAEGTIAADKVYLFVFKSDGTKEYGAKVTLDASSRTTVNISGGQKTVWVVCNAPETITSTVTSLTTFKSAVSSLKDNKSYFIMSGTTEKNVSGNTSVSISVKRIAAKIVLTSVDREFEDIDYRDAELLLKELYLGNAVGEAHYDITNSAVSYASVSTWYNKFCKYDVTDNDAKAVICKTILPSPVPLVNGEPYSFGTDEPAVYAYPNNTATDSRVNTSWSPRYTRLVLNCTLAGQAGVYPVTISNVESNKVYNVAVTLLTKPRDPSNPEGDEEINPSLSFTTTVTVSDWDEAFEIAETI